MKDCLGNALVPGNMIYWPMKQLVAKVIKVDEPQLSNDPPTVTLEVQIEVQRERGKEAQCGLMRIVDPTQDKLLNTALGGSVQ